MHRFSVRIILFAVLLLGSEVAQSQPPEKLEFEVASLRAVGPIGPGARSGGRSGGPGTSDPGQITFSAAQLETIIAYAFDVSVGQISGPGWIINERYDIRAEIPDMTTEAEAKQMLRSLLAERMGLAFHMQTRVADGYELLVARGGARLRESDSTAAEQASQVGASVTMGADGFPDLPPGIHSGMLAAKGHVRFRFSGAPLTDLAQRLGPLLGTEMARSSTGENGKFVTRIQPAPISDITGLMGRYDFTLEYEGIAFYSPSQVPDVLLKIRGALEKQLGLTLVEAKVPESVLVIDSLRKIPEEN